MKKISRCLIRRKPDILVKESVHGLFKTGAIVHILPLVLQHLNIEGQKSSKSLREESYASWVSEELLSKIHFISIALNCDLLELVSEEYEITLQCYIQTKQISKFVLQSRFQLFQANADWKPKKGGLSSSRTFRDDERIDPAWVKSEIHGEIRKNNDQKKHVS